ncbi:peptide deformylase [Radicibacter daui]|uniref:peptide deformylase n=1 Tax=Radicibacter daui TaxID=3064829 RepID=UPI0040469A6C
MTIREILRFPDPRLRQPAASAEVFDSALGTLADDLLQTMRAAPGIGITAPHIGVACRLVVIELPDEGRVRIYVNPRILAASHDMVRHEEGSVSMPGVSAEVERPRQVRVGYCTLDGEEKEEDAEGLLAICLQHEIDQLEGVFWIERLSKLKRDRIIKRYQKLTRSA